MISVDKCHFIIFFSIIHPYISYAILAWGSAYKTHIKKIQTKQNHAISMCNQMVTSEIRK